MEKLEFKLDVEKNLVRAVQDMLPNFSNYQIEKILANKDIKVNGVRVKLDKKLKAGDMVTVFYEADEKSWFSEYFCDENVLIVNKKGGIEVISETDRDLYRILKQKYGEIYPIHRIDRNTEGLVVFARTKEAEAELLDAFKNRTMTKKYLLECEGKVNVDAIKPKLYLKKLSNVSKVLISEVKASGYEEIVTKFKFVRYQGNNTLLEANLVTGKTHQIRAHMSYYKHSIVGDGKYGRGNGKLHLTAYYIKFNFKEKSPLFYLNDIDFEIMPTWLEDQDKG